MSASWYAEPFLSIKKCDASGFRLKVYVPVFTFFWYTTFLGRLLLLVHSSSAMGSQTTLLRLQLLSVFRSSALHKTVPVSALYVPRLPSLQFLTTVLTDAPEVWSMT